MKQGLLIALGGIGLFALTVALARRRLLSLRYTLGWVCVSAFVVAASILTPFVTPLAEQFSMTGTAVFLGAASVVLVLVCIQLSITVSGLHSRLRDTIEANALLEARVHDLEHRGFVPGAAAPTAVDHVHPVDAETRAGS